MSIFSSILQKIGIGKPAAPAAAPTAAVDATVNAAMAKAAEEAKARVAAQAKAAADAAAAAAARVAAAPAPVAAAPTSFSPTIAPGPMAAPVTPIAPAAVVPVAISVVDVVSHLEGLARAHPGLDWKVSIVDLLKLLEIDSSFESRKDLALELGCPANLMNDSASMNIWLHKTVLQKIAENGGNIPASLLS